jgi:hypothetical protein
MSRAALGLLLFAGLLPSGGASASPARTIKSPDGVEIGDGLAGSVEGTMAFVHGWSCDRSYWRAQIVARRGEA